MLSERKIKQLAEARKHIQHKPLSEEGYQVRYGITYMGQYFYEIIDPFEKDDEK